MGFYYHPVRVIVVQSVFFNAPAGFKPEERYDLKGSWVGRKTTLPQKEKLPWKSKDGFGFKGVRKDLDVKGPFLIDEARGQVIAAALNNDSDFLKRHQIMDYSLLVGVSKTVHPISGTGQQPSRHLPSVHATRVIGPEIYCMGIIDVLQRFNFRKRCEYLLKSYLLRQGTGISCVPAADYATRFCDNIVGPMIAGKYQEDDDDLMSESSDGSDKSELELKPLE